MAKHNADPLETGDGDVIVYEADTQWHVKRVREIKNMVGILEHRARLIQDEQIKTEALGACAGAKHWLDVLASAFDQA